MLRGFKSSHPFLGKQAPQQTDGRFAVQERPVSVFPFGEPLETEVTTFSSRFT
jgi:hypothetical protein